MQLPLFRKLTSGASPRSSTSRQHSWKRRFGLPGRIRSRLRPRRTTTGSYGNSRLRRKAILLAAVFFAVMAVAERPWILLSFMSAKGLMNTAVLAVVSLVAAVAVHELGGSILGSPGRRWYARNLALVLLPLLLVITAKLAGVADSFLHSTAGIGPFLPTRAHTYEFVSMTLLWIALLA